LLVEDDESTRDAIAQMLRLLGYEVVAVATPQAALEYCEQGHKPPDLLLTDVILPQMRGSELAQRLSQRLPNLKVLYISGYTANAVVERGELKHGVEFLEKPFTMARLAQYLAKLLNG
jgi:CheY-like chemotaxis protein